MKSRRLISLLLALAMTLPLFACSEDKPDETDPPVSDTTDSTETSEPEETGYTPDLPDITFDYEDFNVLDPISSMQTTLFHVEEDSADVYESALFRRNTYIEDKYKVTFNYETVPSYTDTQPLFERNVMANTADFDLYMLICRDAFASAQLGHIYPVHKIPYLDINAPWYFHSINDQFSIDGKLFYAYSAETLNTFSQTHVVYFNKSVADVYQIDNLYETVRNGEWTLDKMLEYANLVKSTEWLRGDTVYGMVGGHRMYDALWVGCGTRVIEKNEEGIPEFTLMNNEKLLGLLERFVNDIENPMNTFLNIDFWVEGPQAAINRFKEDKALFYVQIINSVAELRDMESDFGIIPLPKYDEEQKEYISNSYDGWIHVVPVNMTKEDMTGVMLEALAAESLNTTVPAYFDVVLDYRDARDPEQSEMLDIVFDNLTIDLSNTVWYLQSTWPIDEIIMMGQNTFTSKGYEFRRSMTVAIKNALEALDKYVD